MSAGGSGPDEGAASRSDLGLRVLAAVGSALFLASFVVAAYFPGILEARARDFIVERVAAEVEATLPALGAISAPGRIGVLAEELSARADSLRVSLGEGLGERLAAALRGLCEYDCPAQDSLEAVTTSVLEEQVSLLDRAAASALSLARGRYSEAARALIQELRIFSGVNATLFLLVLAASLFAPRAPPGARLVLWILLAATLVSILGYFFLQDWFHRVLFGDYVGYGYGLWVAAVFVTLCDWVFLRGRISQALVDFFASVLGAVT